MIFKIFKKGQAKTSTESKPSEDEYDLISDEEEVKEILDEAVNNLYFEESFENGSWITKDQSEAFRLLIVQRRSPSWQGKGKKETG